MKTAFLLIVAMTFALAGGPAFASHRHGVVRVERHEPQVNIYIGPRIRYEPFGVYRVIPRVDYRYYDNRYEHRREHRYEHRQERHDDWRDERRHDNRRDWDDRHRDDRSRRNHYK